MALIALIWKDGRVQHIRERHLHPLTMADCLLPVERPAQAEAATVKAALARVMGSHVATFRRIGIGDEFREI